MGAMGGMGEMGRSDGREGNKQQGGACEEEGEKQGRWVGLTGGFSFFYNGRED